MQHVQRSRARRRPSAFPDMPIIGVIEPGAKAAVAVSNGAPIGVLATTGTIKSEAYVRGVARFDPSVKVVGQACPKFVPLVESGLSGHRGSRGGRVHLCGAAARGGLQDDRAGLHALPVPARAQYKLPRARASQSSIRRRKP